MLVDRELTRLLKDYPDLEVEKVDIITHPLQTWNDGIRMIPALRNGDNILSGIMLAQKDIHNFIEKAA